jgi:hypothetical protein
LAGSLSAADFGRRDEANPETAHFRSCNGILTIHKRRERIITYKRSVFILTAVLTLFLIPLFSGPSCAAPGHSFDPNLAPPPPDYSSPKSWAVLPKDHLPFAVDVFFVHPTTYNGDENWNQSLEGETADRKVQGVMSGQAGVFSTSACLYAPYYRQANLAVLHTPENSPERKSLDTAYSDVEAAFDTYMTTWNRGRPFILAGHSQGSQHLLRLMERRLGDPETAKRLVAAYIIGWSVTRDDLARHPHLKMAETPDQTGCIVSYNTQGPNPGYSIVREGAVAVNPLTMTITGEPAEAGLNLGALFCDGKGVREISHYTGGQTINGAFVIPAPSNVKDLDAIQIPEFYHPYDYAFFFRNLQKNAELRTKKYLDSRVGH